MQTIIPRVYNLESDYDNGYWESQSTFETEVEAARAASYFVEFLYVPEKNLRILDPDDKEI